MSGNGVGDLIDALWQARVVDPSVLEELARDESLRAESARGMAEALVERGILSPFQADECLAGRAQGLVLGPYRFLDQLGSGTLGRVFRARHEPSGAIVAVKVLHPGLLTDPAAAHRFHREAEAAARLAHPGIVAVRDDGTQDGVHYLVMDLVAGAGLERYLEESGPLTIERACQFARQVALALQHAYERRLPPCDVQASDLIVRDGRDRIKLLLAGQGRLGPSARAIGEFEFGTLLEPGREEVDAAVEARRGSLQAEAQGAIRGLGRLLVQMFDGGSAKWPRGLAEVIERMQADEPSRRYATPAACAEALARWAGDDPEAEAEPVRPALAGLVTRPVEVPRPAQSDDPPPGPTADPTAGAKPEAVPALAATGPREAARGHKRPRRALAASVLFLLGALTGSTATWVATERGLLQTGSARDLGSLVELALRAEPPSTSTPALPSEPKPIAEPELDPEAVAGPTPTPAAAPPAAPVEPPPAQEAPPPAAAPVEPPPAEEAPPPAAAPVEPPPAEEAPPRVAAQPPPGTILARPEEQAANEVEQGERELKERRFDEAIAHFSAALDLDPGKALAYTGRAEAELRKFDHHAAVADAGKAIALEARNSTAYLIRAESLEHLGDFGGAIDDCTKVIEREPNNARAYDSRGVARYLQNQTREAIADLSTALRLDPKLAAAHGHLAVVLATATDESLHDGPRAVYHATRACELSGWTNPVHLDHLAVAHASCRQFGQAVQLETLAIGRAGHLAKSHLAQLEMRLKLYRSSLKSQAGAGTRGAAVIRRNPAATPPPPPQPMPPRSLMPPPNPVPVYRSQLSPPPGRPKALRRLVALDLRGEREGAMG